MLPQEHLIQKVKTAVLADARIPAALMYGSFTQGGGDGLSDIEFYLYLRDATKFDLRAWLEENVSPVLLLLVNEFGTPNAIFPGLIRGEFHVEPEAAMKNVLDWPLRDVNMNAMLIKDESGELRAILETLRGLERSPDDVQLHLDQLLNAFIFGTNVLLRGERMRALDHLNWIQRQLAHLARRSGGARDRLTPQRLLERELPPELYERLAATVGPLAELERSYTAAWTLAQDLRAMLPEMNGREDVVAELDARLSHPSPRS